MIESCAAEWLARGLAIGDEEIDPLTGLWLRALPRAGPGIDDEEGKA